MMRLTPLMNTIKIKSKTLLINTLEKGKARVMIRTNLKHFSSFFQNENFKTAKNSSSESIEDIMGNSQDSNYRGNSNMNYQNQNYPVKKRQRLSFLRDGMIISFYLRKVIIFLI